MAATCAFDAKLPKLETKKGDGGVLYKPKQHSLAPKRYDKQFFLSIIYV